jgi:hypothetical protein
MKDEYIIINKTAIQKRIEELEQIEQELIKNGHKFAVTRGKIDELISLLFQSTPLIPEIEKAIQFGKDIRSEKSFINPNFDSPFVDYEDSTEETITYISNLKLDI